MSVDWILGDLWPAPTKLCMTAHGRQTYYLQEKQAIAPPNAFEDYSTFQDALTPICVDNGSSTFRSGWAGESAPRITAENVVSRYRERKTNTHVVLAGAAVYADATSKLNIKYPYEGDVVCAIDAVEAMMDYTFVKLGIDQGDRIAHPIAMTEVLCNPAFSRGLVSELLFECYNVPAVAYADDGLAAFYNSGLTDGIVVSCSASNTVVIPVLNGVAHLECTKRLSWGGSPAADYMLKLLQLKYPTFPSKLTFAQASTLVREHTYLSKDYASDMARLQDPNTVVDFDRVIQAPFQVAATAEGKTEEELAEQAERRREQMRKMQELAAKQRMEKFMQKQEDLQQMHTLKALKFTDPEAFAKGLQTDGFADEAELDQTIKRTEASIEKSRKRAMGPDDGDREEPVFPLVDIPDEQLTEEEIKTKRRQRLMKAGHEARIKARAEKEAEQQRKAEQAKAEEEFRLREPEKWVAGMREQYEDIIERMRDRQKRRTQLGDRKSLAAQNRMKSIASLASDMPPGRKKRKTAEDNFGANDADWHVYREIGGDDDSEEEQDDQEILQDLEEKLLQFDPSFTEDDTADRRALKKTRLLNAFIRGMRPDEPLSVFDPNSAEQNAQIHLNIERIRVPEALFQPSIAGIDQAGLVEIIGHILRQFGPGAQAKLLGVRCSLFSLRTIEYKAQNVFITGGATLTPNFDYRLSEGIQSLLPINTPFRIVRAPDVIGGAWQGLSKWATTPEFQSAATTHQEYYEHGPEYLKEHTLAPKWHY